ncbi:Response regulator receiver [Pseudomonas amygdali pv. mori]|uniref:Response regulator receiver n=1 Tax=Pseudomonas amygdali pv. mori TaxID=34065 RepID=A0A3M4LAW3_PSEA0|nr:Response regulator receiver [Pseudomonas amygdali pv. mori]
MSGLDLIDEAARQGLLHQAILLSGLPDVQLENLQQLATQRDLPLLGCLSKPCMDLTSAACWGTALSDICIPVSSDFGNASQLCKRQLMQNRAACEFTFSLVGNHQPT